MIGQRQNRLALGATAAIILALTVMLNTPCSAPGQPRSPTTATTRASTTRPPAHAPQSQGPEIVVLNELEALYEPVPFEHRRHAEMAEMWDRCVTCHHRSPDPSTRPAQALVPGLVAGQDDAAAVPECKSCHPITDGEVNLRMPSLKGAYHRQCLNCHRDWSGANDCGVCHRPRRHAGGQIAAETAATSPTTRALVDDIVGRMHPPIPEPVEVAYRARYEPAMGANVLFRHREHTVTFGLKCVECHRRDSCASCHEATSTRPATAPLPRPLKPGRTWLDSHRPCAACHARDRCIHCHRHDHEPARPIFDHPTMTGQAFDTDHRSIACRQCHAGTSFKAEPPTCGGRECHRDATIAFPAHRPGPVAATQPTLKQLIRRASVAPSRPIRRIATTQEAP